MSSFKRHLRSVQTQLHENKERAEQLQIMRRQITTPDQLVMFHQICDDIDGTFANRNSLEETQANLIALAHKRILQGICVSASAVATACLGFHITSGGTPSRLTKKADPSPSTSSAHGQNTLPQTAPPPVTKVSSVVTEPERVIAIQNTASHQPIDPVSTTTNVRQKSKSHSPSQSMVSHSSIAKAIDASQKPQDSNTVLADASISPLNEEELQSEPLDSPVPSVAQSGEQFSRIQPPRAWKDEDDKVASVEPEQKPVASASDTKPTAVESPVIAASPGETSLQTTIAPSQSAAIAETETAPTTPATSPSVEVHITVEDLSGARRYTFTPSPSLR